jgi:carbon storage regulator
MLVIRRRAGESILLGDGIEVQVLEVSATRVKLGVIAPRDVLVQRKEVLLSQQQNQAAAQSPLTWQAEALAARFRATRPAPAK